MYVRTGLLHARNHIAYLYRMCCVLWYLPLFLYAVVTIEFQSAVYSVSEGSGSVNIVVAKRGSTTSAIIVEFSTTDVSASGKTVLL